MDFVIRKAKENDLEDLLILENEGFISPYNKDQLLYELKDNAYANFYVLCLEEKIIGFLDYWVTFDSATITQIMISKPFRRMKLATLLLEEMFDDCFAKRVTNITLEVRENNLSAIALYEKNGFKKELIKEKYYSNGDNAVYMIRKVEIA